MEALIQNETMKIVTLCVMIIAMFSIMAWAALVEASRNWAAVRKAFKPCTPCRWQV